MGRIGIIAVSYNTDEGARNFVQNVYSLYSSDMVDLFIVNNSAQTKDDYSFNELSSTYKNFKYIPAPHNPGYFGAAREVLSLRNFDLQAYDWLAVSNVDMELNDTRLFQKILSNKYKQDCGVLAPCIYSLLSHKDTNPLIRVRPSSKKMLFYKKVFSNYFTSQAYNILGILKAKIRIMLSKPVDSSDDISEIYAPQGSFMVFSAEYFKRGGNFDHGVFLYGEEVTVAEKCLRLGLKVIHDPNLRVVHRERGSTGLIYSARILKWKKESNDFLYDEYFKT